MPPLIQRTQRQSLGLILPIGLVGLLYWASAPLAADANAPSEAPAELQARIAELRQHVQGMESKLKESAAARKTADQARMEAERRLAESAQALEGKAEEASALADELDAARKNSAELSGRLQDLQAQLPEAQGGTLTEEAARAAAVEALEALRTARSMLETHASPAAAALAASAELELRRRQFRLANVVNAQSLYRIRTNDSLALIAARFYGIGAQWRTIFEANRHLLPDADRLTPGMTLIIP